MIGWYSQKFPPGGASAAEGIRNQLGQPKLNPLTVLVREAAQNSWDARTGTQPVRFSIALTDLPAGLAPVWRRVLLGQDAPSKAHLPLRTALDKRRLRILTISDRGTRGLGGPTRADNAIVDNNDFVSFVRNVGEPRNTDFGGGTYGFGKGIFYRLSRCGTVLIYTRCNGVNGMETRLVGCSLWQSYTVGEGMSGQRFTGRHWWGDTSGEIIEPLVGEAAESVARQLRLDTFGPNESGTSITIVDPELDMDPEDPDLDAQMATEWMASAIAWNLWPKMLNRGSQNRPRMEFSVTLDGQAVAIPDPESTRPLSQFVTAYRNLESDPSDPIECLKPKKHLGRLSMQSGIAPAFEPDGVAEECGFSGTSHHICLLRSPELVVKYLVGPKTGSTMLGYSGVFRADDDVDDVFAKAEPPTHDDWVSTHLEVPARTYVNVALRRLKEAANKQVSAIQPGTVPQAPGTALGSASVYLSDLVSGIGSRPQNTTGSGGLGHLPGGPRTGVTPRPEPRDSEPIAPGDRAGRPTGSAALAGSAGGDQGSSGSSRRAHRPGRKPSITYHDDPTFLFLDGEPVLSQAFSIEHRSPVTVTAALDVMVAGGRERRTDAPARAASPQVRGWCRPDGSEFSGHSTFHHPGDGSTWNLLVRPAPNTSTQIAVIATDVGNG